MNSSAIFSMIEKVLDQRAEQSAQAEASLSRKSAERQAAFARIAARRQQLSVIQTSKLELSRQADILAQQITKLSVNLSRLQNEYAQQRCQEMNISYAIDREGAILRTTCSPLVDQFVTRIETELERLRKLELQEQVSFGDKNLLADIVKTPRYTHSNAPAIHRRTLALFAARDRAHELALLDLTDEQVQMEMDGIWHNLPTIDNVELVSV